MAKKLADAGPKITPSPDAAPIRPIRLPLCSLLVASAIYAIAAGNMPAASAPATICDAYSIQSCDERPAIANEAAKPSSPIRMTGFLPIATRSCPFNGKNGQNHLTCKNDYMFRTMQKLKITVAIIVIMLAALWASCVTSSGSAPSVSISTDRQEYSPVMSSTVGIGLAPALPSTIDNDPVMFHWHTDFGYFISWKAPGFKVNDLGPDTVADDQIYWSYNVSDMGKDKPPVHVTLSITDRATGKVINTTSLVIGWKEKDMAFVEK